MRTRTPPGVTARPEHHSPPPLDQGAVTQPQNDCAPFSRHDHVRGAYRRTENSTQSGEWSEKCHESCVLVSPSCRDVVEEVRGRTRAARLRSAAPRSTYRLVEAGRLSGIRAALRRRYRRRAWS